MKEFNLKTATDILGSVPSQTITHDTLKYIQRKERLEVYKDTLWNITEGEWDLESLRNSLELKIKILEEK